MYKFKYTIQNYDTVLPPILSAILISSFDEIPLMDKKKISPGIEYISDFDLLHVHQGKWKRFTAGHSGTLLMQLFARHFLAN